MNSGWRPGAGRDMLMARAVLLQRLRQFMSDRDILEVETPLLSDSAACDPQLASVATVEPAAYLRTSPEFPLKRLLAAGTGDCYELGRVFRGAESGRWHNPEFTLLEWYRLGWDHHRLMDEVAALVQRAGNGRFDDWPIHKTSYQQLFSEHTGIDPHEADCSQLAACMTDSGLAPERLDHSGWLDLTMASRVQPQMPEQALNFVYDYPICQAALARIRDDSPPVAERFELYLGTVELANGFHELTDPAEQRRRFAEDNRQRRQTDSQVPHDERFLAALEHGLPDCAGVALGVDRLLMVMTGASHIDQVLAFPRDRA